MDKATHRAIVEKGPGSRGKTLLLKYLDSCKLTRNEAIVAYCYGCMGFNDGGRVSCGIELCPLFPYMPYKKARGEEDGGEG